MHAGAPVLAHQQDRGGLRRVGFITSGPSVLDMVCASPTASGTTAASALPWIATP